MLLIFNYIMDYTWITRFTLINYPKKGYVNLVIQNARFVKSRFIIYQILNTVDYIDYKVYMRLMIQPHDLEI